MGIVEEQNKAYWKEVYEKAWKLGSTFVDDKIVFVHLKKEGYDLEVGRVRVYCDHLDGNVVIEVPNKPKVKIVQVD